MITLVAAALAAPLQPDEVLSSVEAHLPTLVQADRERDRAAAELLGARGAFDLGVSGTGTSTTGYYDYARVDAAAKQKTALYGLDVWAKYGRGTGELPSYYAELETSAAGELMVGADLPLLRDGWTDKDRAGIAVAGLEVDGAAARAQLARLSARQEALSAYWAWVAAGGRLAVADGLLAVAVARNDGLERRIAAGDLRSLDRMENERVIAERRAALAGARRELEVAALKLGLYLRDAEGAPAAPGPDRLPPLPPQPAGPAPELDALLDTAWTLRPELAELDAKQDALAVKAGQAGNQRLPALNLTGGVGRDLDPDAYLEVKLGLGLDVQLQQRAARGAADAAGAERLAVAAKERWTREKIAAEVASGVASVRAARERWGHAAESARLADALVEATRSEFAAGGVTLFEVYLREQAAAQARTAEIDAAREHLQAMVALEAAIGISF